MRKLIFPPFHGEFGHLILHHIRWVHEAQADEKIVYCHRGQEMLYPSATAFEYDWEDALPDAQRIHVGPPGAAAPKEGFEIANINYPEPGLWDKFVPRADHKLQSVHVVFGARKRDFAEDKNWQHWDFIGQKLRSEGYSIGLAGREDVTQDIPADVRAWDHPDGCVAGSIDLFHHCKLFIGTCTGITHLSALCDAPTIAFRRPGGDDWLVASKAVNRNRFVRLPDEAWKNPDMVLNEALKFLMESCALCSIATEAGFVD